MSLSNAPGTQFAALLMYLIAVLTFTLISAMIWNIGSYTNKKRKKGWKRK